MKYKLQTIVGEFLRTTALAGSGATGLNFLEKMVNNKTAPIY